MAMASGSAPGGAGERTAGTAAVAGSADRAVSSVLTYALMLGVVAVLLSALTTGFAPLVGNQQSTAVQSTLEVVGNDVAGDLETADRLAAGAGGNVTVRVRTRLPDRVGGSGYEIDLRTAGGAYEVVLRSPDHDTSAFVRVRTRTDVDLAATGTLDGGDLVISLEGDSLVIRNA